MELKELHLQNIASIEEADIDFEKGLCDGVTGDPASVFLISGDTGAGKSILLDGLAMALYKNTPRISGVANKKENQFTDTTGESIRVGSIEQYTRLGISDKDECYSEVVFIGNDGVEYRARLELGMSLGNTDKTTGRRLLKHRSPKWIVKRGSADWTKDKVEETLVNAVGLSFEQFGRMAMLAQGQFAAFLTGDKKEREAILEQLTNTEHFSKYGAAIKRLFDKAKAAMDQKQVEYDTESQHTLPQEKIDQLTEEKTQLEAEKKALEVRIKDNDNTIALVCEVENARKRANEAGQEKKVWEERADSQSYRSQKALIVDWDATENERQCLLNLREARRIADQAKTDAASQRTIFTKHSADLEARRAAVAAQGNPQKAVEEKQAEIDVLTAQRDALALPEVNKALKQIGEKKGRLQTFLPRLENWRKTEEEVSGLATEIAEEEKALQEKAKLLSDANAVYEAAKKLSSEAASRYLRMNVSLEDTLKDLRKTLAEEHADTCPLCGQAIVTLPHEDDFLQMLSPLEEEKKAAAAKCEEAQKALQTVKTDYDKSSSVLERNRKDLNKREAATAEAWGILFREADALGVKLEAQVEGQIDAISQELVQEETRLTAIQHKAEELQKAIQAAQKEKAPLDEALRKYEADLQRVEVLEGNRKAILASHPDWDAPVKAELYLATVNIVDAWRTLSARISATDNSLKTAQETISACNAILDPYYASSGKSETDLMTIERRRPEVAQARNFVKNVDEQLKSKTDAVRDAERVIREALVKLGVTQEAEMPVKATLLEEKEAMGQKNDELAGKIGSIENTLEANRANVARLALVQAELADAKAHFDKWNVLNSYFGGTRLRTLVQTYILRPLLQNANIYLEKITDRYRLTCSEDNEQLSILVLDRYNKDQIRSVTVLSGGERFMISLALSLALSSLNRPDMNVNILFIDEGFGTLDEKNLDSVMQTLEKLQEIAGESKRRVGIISHREELEERIPVKIHVKKKGEGRSRVEIITGQ